MPQTLYCWRCRMDLPMLTEQEWATLAPHLVDPIGKIKRYLEAHGCSLAEATRLGLGSALDEYERLTGFRETNPNALWHHRLSVLGPPCHVCGKPLRTPQARSCAMCNAPKLPVGAQGA